MIQFIDVKIISIRFSYLVYLLKLINVDFYNLINLLKVIKIHFDDTFIDVVLILKRLVLTTSRDVKKIVSKL